jgi:hypothetical protein
MTSGNLGNPRFGHHAQHYPPDKRHPAIHIPPDPVFKLIELHPPARAAFDKRFAVKHPVHLTDIDRSRRRQMHLLRSPLAGHPVMLIHHALETSEIPGNIIVQRKPELPGNGFQ